jgi:tellurite resistance protein TehA-like permease
MERITLQLFTLAMLLCGSLAIGAVWFGGALPEAYFQAGATLFIIGFASFLIWAPLVVYRFLAALRG